MDTDDLAPHPPSLPDWQAALASQWQALGREILGLHTGPRRTLTELGHECERLVVAVAVFETRGNLTHAAIRLGTSRKAIRERLAAFRKDNPLLVPPRPEKAGKPRRRRKRGSRILASPPDS